MGTMKAPTSTSSNNTEGKRRPLQRLSGWRKAKDRLANFIITAGGMGVLFAITLIFFYLFYEIMPLFKSADIEQQSHYQLPFTTTAKPIYLAMEEQAEVATQLDDRGQLIFFNAKTGALIKQQNLIDNQQLTAYGQNSFQDPLFALATGSGNVVLVKPLYKVSYPNDQREITPVVEFPYGADSLKIASQQINTLAVRDSEAELLLVAATAQGLVGFRYIKEEDFLSDEIVLVEERITLPVLDIASDWMLIGPDQRWLYVVNRSGDYRVIDLNTNLLADSGRLLTEGSVTDVSFLLGDISLLVSSDQGQTSQWFMVREDGKLPRLESIRSFQNDGAAIKKVAVEHRRKGFVSVDSNNILNIYHTTSSRHLLSQSIAEGATAIEQLTLAPRANALLSLDDAGTFHFWKINNEHPEVSWSVLWNKIWYESYSEPDYIWQSSASNNDFEPKFSFSPLAFGTLKAAFYAMIVAAPLAVCGAIYTAYFMTPGIRRKVKPLIELMEALPTVILGFLAGLWLAPFIERNLAGVVSVFILLPVAILLFGYCWSRLPAAVRQTVPEGWHAVLLVPVVVLVTWASVNASGLIELLFFSGDMRAWLTHDLGVSFDQRNAMVVGIAMGFAVVPTIFSIAEDAIFSVPKSLTYGSLALGATPWQSLIGVVIPTASPGIFSALMIGMGRAVGETMIVLMATGNTPIMDANIFEGMRTLAANIAVEVGETEVDSSHYRVLFLAAFVLFLFTFVVNTVAEVVRQRLRKKYGSL